MKKILFFVAIVASLFATSCSKDIYTGDEKSFTYAPTNIRVISVGLSGSGMATVALSNGQSLNLRVISPSQKTGDGFFVEAPIIPQSWVWDRQSNEYKPSGFNYNVAYGFSASYATVYFVEIVAGIPYLNKRSVLWSNTPDPASWVNSFDNMIGSTRRSMPVLGTVTKEEGFPDRYFFAN